MSVIILLLSIFGCTLQGVYGRHAYSQDLAVSASSSPCQDINQELGGLHQVLLDARTLIGMFSQNVSTAWVNSWEKCPQPNVFKAIPCFLEVYGEYKSALVYYRADINKMNGRLYNEMVKFYQILWKCLNSFHYNYSN